jgi:hypothetical protein
MNNSYTTIYDLATEPYDWVWAGFCALLLIVALLTYYFLRDWSYCKSLLQGSLMLGLLTGLAPYLHHRWMLHQQCSQKQAVVEGPVSEYWKRSEYRLKEDTRGRTVKVWNEYEGFTINGITFAYLLNASAPYFHNAGETHLSINDGMMVRIQYVTEPILGDSSRNRILKLEIQPYSLQPPFPTNELVHAALN